MSALYPWIKAVHVIAVISWMAGLLYLPRLYVYHAGVLPGSESAAMFQRMERKLMHMITVPAMTLTWILGLILVSQIGLAGQGWLHVKLALVVLMTIYNFVAERWRRDLAAGNNAHSPRFFRLVNEIPTVLMILIVLLAVAKPF
jgi:putative membrane protein